MNVAYLGREAAKDSDKYKPKDGDTLTSIAAAYPTLADWKELAIFNIGTDDAREVNRALVEQIGCADVAAKAEATVLKPFAKAKEILIPRPLTLEDLDLTATHVIEVRPLPLPAVAIGITTLDKWFIPGKEECELLLLSEGSKDAADTLDVEVYGSKYCECTDAAKGIGKYKDLPDEPVYKEAVAAPAERAENKLAAAWKGTANAAKGILSVKPGAGDRVICSAFSPYTVQARYYNQTVEEAETKARLDLLPFWPQWDKTGKLVDASLKIEWEVKGTERLTGGQIIIVDKTDKVVRRLPLLKDDLTKAKHDVTWDGKDAAGTMLAAAKMPYRVQIQAHTPVGEKKGLALAAMHTEVRVYVAPATVAPSADAYNPATAPQSMLLALGDLAPGDAPAPGDTDDWVQYELARCGFHPGPVSGKAAQEPYKLALKEFQRSVPKVKSGLTFERLAITGAKDADTRAKLAALADSDKRPWFGNPSDQSDYTLDTAAPILRNNGQELIVWVDDRNCFTNGATGPKGMGDYRGKMDVADGKVTKDAESIARPWLPLKVTPMLVPKGKGLTDTVDLPDKDSGDWAFIRAALGPLRVDWSFDEVDPVSAAIIPITYDKSMARPRKYVEWVLGTNKAKKQTRKDTGKERTYTNCPEDCGGIRPDTLATYYSKAFGSGDLVLAPWETEAVAATESVATVVHDRLIAGQDPLKEKQIGGAGVYFNPSLIAGDGYRIRADVVFAKFGSYAFPNLEVLEKRYPKTPQVHTCKLRLWRKGSIRGYMLWAENATGHWPGFVTGINSRYHPAYVHFVHEGGTASTFAMSDLYDDTKVAHQTRYADIINAKSPQPHHQDNVTHPTYRAKLNSKYVWPWNDLDDLGWPWSAPPNTTLGKLYADWLNKEVIPVWRAYREPLLSDAVELVEGSFGKLRGHLCAEFVASPKYYVEAYVCTGTCGNKYYYLERTSAGGRALNRSCEGVGCTGKMRRQGDYTGKYKCPVCNAVENKPGDTQKGDKFVGQPCGASCTALTKSSACTGSLTGPWTGHYTCARGHAVDKPGDGWFGNNWNGKPCPTCANPALVRDGAPVFSNPKGPEDPLYNNLPLPAVGLSLGATWLFTSSDEDTWAHEMGHHRQLEHSASAPGAQYEDLSAVVNNELHDSELNTAKTWPGTTANADKRWDRDCIMSYTSREALCFCGKCLLRQRGWKVQALPYPGTGIKDA